MTGELTHNEDGTPLARDEGPLCVFSPVVMFNVLSLSFNGTERRFDFSKYETINKRKFIVLGGGWEEKRPGLVSYKFLK
jgi:hypothetical protein